MIKPNEETDFIYPVKPFRWNILKRNELGNLLEGPTEESYEEFEKDLIQCCAKILGFSNNTDLYFVGRSPESIYDKMSGLLYNCSWFSRLHLLFFSMRQFDESIFNLQGATLSFRKYLTSIGLSPKDLLTRERPVSFIDLVYSGETLENLIKLFYNWSLETKTEWAGVGKKIRILGITEAQQTSPKTWRWQQHSTITQYIRLSSIKNISIPYGMWQYLGNYQKKVTKSFTPWRWGDYSIAQPDHDQKILLALRLAFQVFENGRSQEQRNQLLVFMVQLPAMRFPWYRSLINELKKT